MSKVIAMIPARMSSKRIKKKNIRLLNGKPMIEYVIDAARQADCFDEIWVNSESDIIGDIAKNSNVKFYKRPLDLCHDNVGSDLFVHDFIKNIECDTIIQILPTSPFIDPLQIREFVQKARLHDTLISVKSAQIESMFKGRPINFDQKKPTPPSQDLMPIELYACSLMSWKTKNYIENMQKYGSAYHGGAGDISTYEIKGHGTLDIDNEEDFKLAEAIALMMTKENKPPKYYDDEQVYDADRLRVLLDGGVHNNTMYEFNQELVSIAEIRSRNPKNECWSHTIINSKSNSATLIAQMPGEGNRMHYHSDWDEWWHIIDGEWEWFIEGKTVRVKKGDIVFIERNKVHKITAVGNKQAIRLAVSREDVDHIYEKQDY